MGASRTSFRIESLLRDRAFFIESVWFDPRGALIWPGADIEALNRSFKKFSARAILMATEDDVVFLSEEPERAWLDFLSDIGSVPRSLKVVSGSRASLIEDIIAEPDAIARLKEFDGAVETYSTTSQTRALEALIGRPINPTPIETVELLNDKVFFLRLLEDTGLGRSDCFVGGAAAIAHKIRLSGTAVCARAQNSVGGSRVFIARSGSERVALADRIAKSRARDLFILEPAIEALSSPNVQYYVDDYGGWLISISDQIIENGRHVGNVFVAPPDRAIRDRLLQMSEILAREAASMGYRGLLGIDFIIDRVGEIFPVEFNARHNTSTAAAIWVNRTLNSDPLEVDLSARAAMVTLATRRSPSLTELIARLAEGGSILYDTLSGRGAIPVSVEPGGATFIAIGADESDRRALTDRLADRL